MDADILRSIRGGTDIPLTAPLVRAARAGLGLSMLDLARSAGLSVSLVSRVERGRGGAIDEATMGRLRRALEAAGAEFPDAGAGVMLRLPAEAD